MMKASRVVVVGIVMVAIFLCWLNSVHAGPSLWPNNKGEICLKNNGPGPGTGEFVRMAVMRTIGNHYIVHGFVIELSGNKTLFNGNAIVDGNWILMNVNSSGSTTASEVHGFVGRVELDASTLTGWVVGVGFHCEEDPATDDCAFGYDGVQQLIPDACP
jgi:hypothetical protein